MGTSMHMHMRGQRCLGPPWGHPPRPGRRHPPPEPWGSPTPHQPALGAPAAPQPAPTVARRHRSERSKAKIDARKRRRCRSLPAPRTPANVRDRWICIRRRGSELGRVGGVVGRKRCKHGSPRPRTHKHAPPHAPPPAHARAHTCAPAAPISSKETLRMAAGGADENAEGGEAGDGKQVPVAT